MSQILLNEWKTIDDRNVKSVSDWILSKLKFEDIELMVGTDSQQTAEWTKFVSVIVARRPGNGASALYYWWREPRIKNLRQRLLKETMYSTQLALELIILKRDDETTIIGDTTPLSVHIDVNLNEKFDSSRWAAELAGMVVGQGFKVVLKPDSWVSTHVADRVVKLKNK